ncbi:hypothetical protein [Neisseria maigaei]|uniref:hypothetical protein n=1 Tax=Neisseria maigaei TaxID=2830651 RepID=UPI002658D92C|nr:hypothetical protein [Neisseria maigaei]
MTQYLPFFSLSIIRYAQITTTQADTVPIASKKCCQSVIGGTGQRPHSISAPPNNRYSSISAIQSNNGYFKRRNQKTNHVRTIHLTHIPTTILYHFHAMLK